MSLNTIPRLSIGMPVYNGEKYISAALDSILAQTFGDFELIISDNASMDRTPEICKVYREADPRIRYYCFPQNVGAAMNFNRTVELARGEYFKWAAHDDVLAPDFLQCCIEVLDQNPPVVICHSRTQFIDERGEPFREYDVTLRTDSPDPGMRFRDLLCVRHQCHYVFGVMRREILLKTPLIEPYSGSDRVVLLGMSLFGPFHEIPDYLFSMRKHAGGSSRAYPKRRDRMLWFDPAHQGHVVLPVWDLFLGFWRTVGRSPLSWRQRLYCYEQLARWFRRRWPNLRDDLTFAARQLWYIRTPRLRANPGLGIKGLMGILLRWEPALLLAVALIFTVLAASFKPGKRHTRE